MKNISIPAFCSILQTFYAEHKRSDLSWRKKKNLNAYAIVVSECMLQQTQVSRVEKYFQIWMERFPDIYTLAESSTVDVLQAWQGLGYNNRALRLQKMAQSIISHYAGTFPKTVAELVTLPGVGPYTAGAVCAFAFNKWNVIIETNIRRILIYHFYNTVDIVDDRTLLIQLADIIHYIQNNTAMDARNFYWACMDYGSALSKTVSENPNKKSRHYTKQSNFKGSVRQARSLVVKLLLQHQKLTLDSILKNKECILLDRDIVDKALSGLVKDKIISIKLNTIFLVP